MYPTGAAVIDLGSNTAKLVNYRIVRDGSFEHYQDESTHTRLGEGLTQTGFLGDEAMDRAIPVLRRFREIVDLQSIRHILPVATSAVREAANGAEFLLRVRRETGFKFRILTIKEEALYSYFGAACSLRIPSMLFFDLGGGSLEIVLARNFEIKRIMSLPLGALRLTQMYADDPDGSFSVASVEKMKDWIAHLIPSRDELDMDPGTVMVGVGGTLRNIVKFHQSDTGYPLTKLHNYSMSDGAIGKISNMLQGMKPGKIAKIQSINTGRAGTVTAGACVIDMLMRSLEFGRIALSAHALREGTLGVSLAFAKSYSGGRIITEEQIGRAVRAASAPDPLPDYLGTLLGMLEEDGRLEESGSRILAHALAHLPPTSSFRNLSGMLRMTMDVDSHLSHREQMISSLSVITYRKKRAAEQASSGFEALLRPRDRKTVKRISSLLALKEVLDTAGTGVSVQRVPGGISFEIRTTGTLQEILLKGAIKRVSASFGISAGYRISDQAP